MLVAALSGCAAGGVKVTEVQLSSFKAGETTRTQVIASAGAPSVQMRLADGTSVVVYSYFEAKVRPETFIPFVGGLVGGSDSTSTTSTLRFDANDRLIDTTSTVSAYGMGTGFAAGQITPTTLNQPVKQKSPTEAEAAR